MCCCNSSRAHGSEMSSVSRIQRMFHGYAAGGEDMQEMCGNTSRLIAGMRA